MLSVGTPLFHKLFRDISANIHIFCPTEQNVIGLRSRKALEILKNNAKILENELWALEIQGFLT